MNDLISRQAAIDAIFSEPLYESGMKKRDADVVVPAIFEKIKTLPSTDEWIPCSERLPRKNGKYLCCWQGASVGTGMFLDGHFRLYGEIKDNLVTAWQPLPKPYGGAND